MQEKRDILIFFGILAILGAAFAYGTRYIQAAATSAITNHFAPATSTPLPANPTTPVLAETTTSTLAIVPTGSVSAATSSKATGTGSAATPSTPPPSPPAPPAPATPPASAVNVTPLSLPYSAGTLAGNSFSATEWGNWWGDSAVTNGTLAIGANDSTTGGGALLKGSSAWTDLTFQADVNWYTGETFGLVARYIDDSDYVVCEFDEKNLGDVHLRLDEHLNGAVIHLADGDVLNYNEMGGANIPAAIQVHGDEGSCAFDGYVVSSVISSTHIDPSLSHGEIGFTTWDPNVGNSEIAVKSVGAVSTIYNLGTYVTQTPE